ncbi:TetR/AcrR family transcriptional regulator [Pseudomaricurvus sp. HS19]|uniref:TetR/AcrR family transcriptional regulator n=1 Tax=Pseudomaricurvus sp. HS19 TaxID=2692626 RepID=UPI001369AE14|nr:TetR family transcriptional regulator [Pseudomaricurvus sp. HS19]
MKKEAAKKEAVKKVVVKKETAKKRAAPARPRAGRPTREEAARRHEELLDSAIDWFLESGYDNTRVIDIADSLGMSKRTVYAYYKDKEALFIAAVDRLVERYIVPIETLQAAETDDLEETLRAVARIRIANVATPAGIKLQRILNAQSHRFPDLINRSLSTIEPTLAFLSGLFRRLEAQGKVRVTDAEAMATAFLSLVVSGPSRMIIMGGRMEQADIEARINFSVDLFLNGIRPR